MSNYKITLEVNEKENKFIVISQDEDKGTKTRYYCDSELQAICQLELLIGK